MEIEFKNSVGSAVGYVEGDDVFDTRGNKIGQVGEWGIYRRRRDGSHRIFLVVIDSTIQHIV